MAREEVAMQYLVFLYCPRVKQDELKCDGSKSLRSRGRGIEEPKLLG